jgi:hypothetical protein
MPDKVAFVSEHDLSPPWAKAATRGESNETGNRGKMNPAFKPRHAPTQACVSGSTPDRYPPLRLTAFSSSVSSVPSVVNVFPKNPQMWKTCQEFSLNAKVMTLDLSTLTRQNTQSKLALFLLRLGILIIEGKK